MSQQATPGEGPAAYQLPAPHRRRVSAHPRLVELGRAQAAAAELLTALGLPVDSEGMRDTPGRLTRAYLELLTLPDFEMTTFPNDEGYDELVVIRDIPCARSASTTCCPSSVSHTSATCPARGSSG